ncbi:MAG: type IV secretion system protein [Alphaproteobacteria bacterium]
MNSGQQTQGGLYEGGIGWAIMLVIFAVLIWLFWIFFDTEVRNMVRWIRYSEMQIVNIFVDDEYTVEHNNNQLNYKQHLNGYTATVIRKSRSGQTFRRPEQRPGVGQIEAEELDYHDLSRFTSMTMRPMRNLFIGLLGAGALYCMFMGPGTNYRRRLDIEGLIGTQSKVFPVITPFIKFNPATQPPRPPGAPVPAELPAFAEALGPEEWLAYNNIQIPDGKIDHESASEAFIEQLGKPWRGVRGLAPYKQILLAAFCLRAARKRSGSDDLLGRIAKCWDFKTGLNLKKDGKLLKDAQKILRDKKLAGETLAQANRHAFEATAMLRALQYAREEGGVMAPAQFVWLRAHDRHLWYPLNNMGRQAYHMEALGAMSHFKAERLTQRPIPVPKVEHALETIEEYMASARARPVPQLDYSQSKKRGVKKAV